MRHVTKVFHFKEKKCSIHISIYQRILEYIMHLNVKMFFLSFCEQFLWYLLNTKLWCTGNISTRLAVHLLEDLKLGCFVFPIKSVITVVPVSHHTPALESSPLSRYGLLCKLTRWIERDTDSSSLIRSDGANSLNKHTTYTFRPYLFC